MNPHGVHIYNILKYGCQASSWLAAITIICPSLELIGSKQLVDHLHTYVKDEWKANKHVTKESTAAKRTKLERKRGTSRRG